LNAITLSELAAVRAVAQDAAPVPGDLARALSQVPSQGPSQRPPQLKTPVQQFSWQSRFGIMLIEVRGDAVYVNGQLVEQVPPSL
jgi:hypothetical protein